MKNHSLVIRILLLAMLSKTFVADACRWDADTLKNEKKKKPEIAEIIFGTRKEPVDVARLQNRIANLKANPRQDDPDWWNNFAGAYIQLGQPQRAAELLEPVLEKFKDNYGVHANLGTAYHLLGRYQEAEKEIARDLEINPEAHFGLEKYHLALLQYLSRDAEYQKQHVYVEEWTKGFFSNRVESFSYVKKEAEADAEVLREDLKHGITNSLPAYALKWNLAADPKFEEGIRYMATLNPKQPACFTMLGIVCAIHRNFNLAAAFEKAIVLNSPQKEILQTKVAEAKEFISKSPRNAFRGFVIASIAVILFWIALRIIWKKSFRRPRQIPS
jgi:hypothetical protein